MINTMMTLGLMLTAKDMLSPVLGKASESVIKLKGSTQSLTSPLQGLSQRVELVGGSFTFGAKKIEGMTNSLAPLNGKIIGIKIILQDFGKTVDSVTDKAQEKIIGFSDRMGKIGAVSMGAFMGTQGVAKGIISAYAELEQSQNDLQNSLMDNRGVVDSHYTSISKTATRLGADLPGTTKDFYDMAVALRSKGVTPESIEKGGLEASAKMAVVLKNQGVDYKSAALSVGEFKNALNISDSDMLPFINDIQKMVSNGSSLENLKYAYIKVGSAMEGLGQKGLVAARQYSPLIGMLTAKGISGEIAGSGITSMLSKVAQYRGSKGEKKNKKMGYEFHFFDSKGKLISLEEMTRQFSKIKNLSDKQKTEIFENLGLNGSQETMLVVNKLMEVGTQGVKEYNKGLVSQADLNQKIANSLGTLSNRWETFTGSATTFLGVVGSGLSPALKGITDLLNRNIGTITNFTAKHTTATKIVGGLVLGFVGVMGVLGPLALAVAGTSMVIQTLGIKTAITTVAQWAFNTSLGKSLLTMGWVIGRMVAMGGILTVMALKTGLVTAAQWLLNGAMLANPIGLLVVGFTALVGIGAVLYKNFLPFKNLIDGINQSINQVMGKDGWLGKLATIGIDAPATPKFSTAQKSKELAVSSPNRVNIQGLKQGNQVKIPTSVTHNHHNSFVIQGNGSDPQKQAREIQKHLVKMQNDLRDRSFGGS